MGDISDGYYNERDRERWVLRDEVVKFRKDWASYRITTEELTFLDFEIIRRLHQNPETISVDELGRLRSLVRIL